MKLHEFPRFFYFSPKGNSSFFQTLPWFSQIIFSIFLFLVACVQTSKIQLEEKIADLKIKYFYDDSLIEWVL